MRKTKPVQETVTETEPVTQTGTKSGALYIVLPMLYEILLGGFMYLKAPDMMFSYMIALVGLLLATAIIGSVAYYHDCDMKLFMSIALLTATGIALQMSVDAIFQPEMRFSGIKYLIALAIAMVFLLFYPLIRKLLYHPYTVWIMFGLSALIYLFLLFFGVDFNGNGTSAWVMIGPYSLQLTDFAKLSAIFFYSSLFATHQDHSTAYVLSVSSAFILVQLIGSVLIRELGSFFILFFLHLAVLFIFFPKGKTKRLYLLTIAIGTVTAVVLCFVLYKALLPSYEAGALNGLTRMIWPIVQKVYTRFSLTANITQDPYGSGYQLLQGKRALWMSGFFGNTVNFNMIPVAESDMAFVAMVCIFGIPMGIFVFFLFLYFFLHGCELSISLLEERKAEAVLAFSMAVLIFGQAVIVILGSCNLIPFTGLPIPFLSHGSTYQAIVFTFVLILLRLSRQEEEEPAEGGEPNENEKA